MPMIDRPRRVLAWIAVPMLLAGIFAAPLAGDRDGDGDGHQVVREWTSDGAYLGVRLEGTETGVRIDEVVPGSPAAEAGLRAGDVVTGFDGEPVDDGADLARRIREREPGDTVEVEVLRDGRTMALDATLGERTMRGAFRWRVEGEPFEGQVDPEWLEDWSRRAEEMAKQWQDRAESWEHEFGGRFDEDAMRELEERFADRFGDFEGEGFRFRMFGKPRLGVSLTETTPELRAHLGGSEDRGVLVSRVHEDTAAETAGVRVGDLITAVDGEGVADSAALRRAIQRAEGTVRLELVRDGRLTTLDVNLPEREPGSIEPQTHRRPRPERGERASETAAARADRLAARAEHLAARRVALAERLAEREAALAERLSRRGAGEAHDLAERQRELAARLAERAERIAARAADRAGRWTERDLEKLERDRIRTLERLDRDRERILARAARDRSAALEDAERLRRSALERSRSARERALDDARRALDEAREVRRRALLRLSEWI